MFNNETEIALAASTFKGNKLYHPDKVENGALVCSKSESMSLWRRWLAL